MENLKFRITDGNAWTRRNVLKATGLGALA
jgi:hypothetical protein